MNIKDILEVRPAVLEDYNHVCELFRQLDAHHTELLPDIFQPFEGEARSSEQFQESIASSSKVLFLALKNSEYVGFIDVSKSKSPSFPMFRKLELAVIDTLFVVSNERGNGVGGALFSQAKKWAADNGVSKLQLKVYTANTLATEFYLKEGMVALSSNYELSL